MATDHTAFIAQRGHKIFQCNFSSGPGPQEYLGVAANGLSGIADKFTGQKVWNISKQPLPLPEDPRGFYVFATAKYPVANIGGTVSLTLGAIPEGPPGTRVLAVFQDSTGWDIATAEMSADLAMRVIAQFLNGRFPSNGGWRMLQGMWRFGHHFDAPPGVPPPPPQVVAPDVPDDFFSSPRTSRGFGTLLFGIDPASLIRLAGSALTDSWNVEFTVEEINGARVEVFGGTNRAWPAQAMQMTGVVVPQNGGLFLTVIFADAGYWASAEAARALGASVAAINRALQTRFPGKTLNPLRAPGT